MENIQATNPLQLVHLDYLTIRVTEGGKDAHIIIITNHSMKYAQALVTSSQTAKCTAQALRGQFIVPYGLPESKISDQGWNFKSDLISELCKLAKVQELHTIPYHPQTNGQCKWFSHTLINMLDNLPPNRKSSWSDMASTLVHAFNCTRSRATGFSPYYLMYGLKPQLRVNVYFGTQKTDMNATTSTRFVQQMCERLRWVYRTTQHVIEKKTKDISETTIIK